MRLIIILAFMSTLARAEDSDQERPVPVSDEPTQTDYDTAHEFGFTTTQVDIARHRIKLTFRPQPTERRVTRGLDSSTLFAKESDASLGRLIKQAATVMRFKGYPQEANELEAEYNEFYPHAIQLIQSGNSDNKEIGDHPPLNKFLTKAHAMIEDAIGEVLCKQFHFHDLFIFNYAVPVVFNPKLYELPEYKDHFNGHLLASVNKWIHHGLAGVVTYWAVNVACMAGTSGIGAGTFVCGPIATFSENIMDKKIAPPIALKIWTKAHN